MARESVNDIVKSAQTARRSLSDLEQKLQAEIDSIDFEAFRERRDLTADEADKRTQLRASQGEVRDAFIQLAFVTVSRLDDSDELAALNGRLDRINRGLADDLNRLNRVASFAKTVSKVAEGVAKVATQLAKLASVA